MSLNLSPSRKGFANEKGTHFFCDPVPPGSGAEDARGLLSHGLLPVGYLDGVNVEFLSDLLDRFDALERLKRYAGFELGIVSFSFAFHFVCVRFGFNAAPSHHNHSLTTGLIFQSRLTVSGSARKRHGFSPWPFLLMQGELR